MRRFGASLVIAATAVATFTPTDVAAAALADCHTTTPVAGDVDGDGKSDLVVGIPAHNGKTGEVDLRLTAASAGPSACGRRGRRC